MSNENDDRRPLWQELLLLAIPILLTEGIQVLREQIHRKAKEKRKLEKRSIPTPRA